MFATFYSFENIFKKEIKMTENLTLHSALPHVVFSKLSMFYWSRNALLYIMKMHFAQRTRAHMCVRTFPTT